MRKIKLLLLFLFCFQAHITNAEEIAQNWQSFPTSQQNQTKFEIFDSKSFLYPMIHGGFGLDFGLRLTAEVLCCFLVAESRTPMSTVTVSACCSKRCI